MKPATLAAAILLFVVAILHLIRLFFHVEVTINGAPVPMWLSILGFLLTAGLALMMWRENWRRKTSIKRVQTISYTIEGLENMIYELHPEIVQHAMNLSVSFDEEKSAYVLKFSRGGHELLTYLDKQDADECMGGKKCLHLGVQIAQFLDDFEEIASPRKPAQ
jgi:membrane protein implicated in regulation of membrane protease activity